jgi:hypothetical protein
MTRTKVRCRCRSSRPFLDRLRHGPPRDVLRLRDPDADGANWREVAKVVLSLDVEKDPNHTNQVLESHLARAKWMTTNGYRQLMRGGVAH